MSPAALALKRHQPLDRRAGDHDEGDALSNVARLAVPGAHQRGAHGAGALPLRAVHLAVGDERRFVAEELGEANGSVLTDEAMVAGHLAPGRQRSALPGHPLDVPAELDLLGQQCRARGAVLGTLVGEADRARLRRLGCGRQSLFDVHRTFSSWSVGLAAAARSSVATSSLIIPSIASVTRRAFARSGSLISSSSRRGTICQATP